VKLLFDQNVFFRVVKHVLSVFPEAIHVRDVDLTFSSDRQIWNYAKAHHYTIVTYDSDFYDLVTLHGHPPKIIWLRLGNTTTKNLGQVLVLHAKLILQFLTAEEFKELACLELNC
jgi:predicted nuclease of predicted toxin-antitoxin system